MDSNRDVQDYERMLTDDTFRGQQLKRFAATLAEIEASHGRTPTAVLINGIKRDDTYRAVYRVGELEEVSALLKGFLTVDELGPDVLINGLPGQFFDVQVTMDLR